MKYDVCVTRDITESFVLKIEANSSAEAEALALNHQGEYPWEIDDSMGQPYVSWSEMS